MLIALVVALFVMGEGVAEAPSTAATPGISPALGSRSAAGGDERDPQHLWRMDAGSAYFGEEIVEPRTQYSPRRPSAVMLLVIALYVAVNAALLHVLTPAQMAASELPAADAAARVFGPADGTLITVVSLISVAAIANLYVMFNSRIGFAMARDGVLPNSVRADLGERDAHAWR